MASPSSDKNTSSSSRDPHRHPLVEEMVARAAANANGPPHREKILPSQRIDHNDRPGSAASGDRPYNPGGPIRLLTQNGVLTKHGERVEQERSAKAEQERLAKLAAATSADKNREEEETVPESLEESSS